MILANAGESLSCEVLLPNANVDFYVAFTTVSATSVTPETNVGNILLSANTTVVVDAPAAGTQRKVNYASFFNKSNTTNRLVIKTVVGASLYNMDTFTLLPGEFVTYTADAGFKLIGTGGYAKVFNPSRNITKTQIPPMMATYNLTGVATTSNTGLPYAVYLGKATKSMASDGVFSLKWRVATVAAGVTWAEVAIAKGVYVPGAATTTLSVVGSASVATSVLGVGVKQTAIQIDYNHAICEGDDLWVTYSWVATTAPALRGLSIVDEILTGYHLTSASVMRPSTLIGASVTYTPTYTATPLWCAVTY